MRHINAKGSALLTALFIMTLVAIVATAMTVRLQLDIYRTRIIIDHDKLYLAAQAVNSWALSELSNKKIRFNTLDAQGMVAQYPTKMAALYPKVKLSGGIYDLQGRFNLNNLIEKKWIPVFVNLLEQTSPTLKNGERLSVAQATKDWLMNYDLARGKDNYTSYYLAQKPPYYPGRQLMKSVSEFRLIKDVSAETFTNLAPFITVLPELTSININTAPQKVLMGLGNGISEAHSSELIAARGEQGIENLKEIGELLKKLDIPNDEITIDSQYYLSVANASNDESNIVVYTLLKRSKDRKGKLTVSMVRESINSF